VERWRPVAVADDGKAAVPLFVTMRPVTDLVVGHPVSADERGRDLFIQVTKISDHGPAWHVSVNNPTEQPITTTLRTTMPADGLDLAEQTLTLKPGEYRVLLDP
jgi:hypothetical protein